MKERKKDIIKKSVNKKEKQMKKINFLFSLLEQGIVGHEIDREKKRRNPQSSSGVCAMLLSSSFTEIKKNVHLILLLVSGRAPRIIYIRMKETKSERTFSIGSCCCCLLLLLLLWLNYYKYE